MEKNVTKADIVKALLPVIRLTRAGANVSDITLTDDGEYANILYSDGSNSRCDVSCDSGMSLIRDICQQIG